MPQAHRTASNTSTLSPAKPSPHTLANVDSFYLNLSATVVLAFALAVPHAETFRTRDDVGFFQAVRPALSKRAVGEARPEEDLNLAVRQIVSRAVASEGVSDVFEAAGLDKPDISVLSEEFLAEVQGMPQRNLAVELLHKLSGAKWPPADAPTWCRPAPLPRCWNRPYAATRIEQSKRYRSSRN